MSETVKHDVTLRKKPNEINNPQVKLKLWTVQLAKWRLVQQLKIPLVDITVKTGDKRLAPSWDFLMEYKNSAKDEEAEKIYTEKYRAKMNAQFRADPDPLVGILFMGEVAIACMCPDGKFCHRHLLATGLVNLGKRYNVEVILMGELKPEGV